MTDQPTRHVQPALLVLGALLAIAAFPPVGDFAGKKAKPATDLSGIACAPPTDDQRLCLVVDDETQGAQIAMMRQDRLIPGAFIRLAHDQHDGKPLELDAEAVAYADGLFYVAGSHGRPRHEAGRSDALIAARTQAARRIFRIDLSRAGVDRATGKMAGMPVIAESRPVLAALLANPIMAAADRPLDAGGLTIEGLAVAGPHLTLGFRGPVASGNAYLAHLPLAALFGKAPMTSRIEPLAMGRDSDGQPRGIRDLAAVDDGLIGIAGPVLDPADSNRPVRQGDYALFHVGRAGTLRSAALPAGPPSVKPEGLALLRRDGMRLRVLLLHDGPANGGAVIDDVEPGPT